MTLDSTSRSQLRYIEPRDDPPGGASQAVGTDRAEIQGQENFAYHRRPTTTLAFADVDQRGAGDIRQR